MLRRALAVAVCLIPLGEIAAQNPAPARHAVLQGIVVDSVRGGVLRGAMVGLLGPSRMTFTDSLGRFRIDSIAPGEYQVALFDPLLDTLALGVVSPRTLFAAGDTVDLVLAVPSQLAIVTAKCGPARSEEEDRALFGQILDAATEQPVAGARVALNWTELTISERTGVRSEPRRREAESDARGYYKMCGLPPDLTAEASVRRGADSTGKVQIAFGDALLGLATFLLPGSAPAATAARDTIPRAAAPSGTASIAGTVVDGDGKPVGNAHVSVTGGNNAATTDSSGSFTLTGQPTGTHALVVRRLGYMPIEIAVNLTPLRITVVAVQMQQYVPVLAAVIIEGNRLAALDRVGFNQRKTRGTGRYIESNYIRNRNAYRLSNLLEGIPNLRRPGDGFGGGGCINYWVDGNFWRGGTPEDFVMPDEVEAIEVYSGSFTPAEFQTLSTRANDRCSTVVVWTRWKLRL